MESLTIRVSRSTHGRLRELSDRTGETMADIVDQAVRNFQRERFWADYQAAYAVIQADALATAEVQSEVDSWDSTLADGLGDQSDEKWPGPDSLAG